MVVWCEVRLDKFVLVLVLFFYGKLFVFGEFRIFYLEERRVVVFIVFGRIKRDYEG